MAKTKKPVETPVEHEAEMPAAAPEVPVSDNVVAPSDGIDSKKQPNDGVQ